jgi:hypothetical protein
MTGLGFNQLSFVGTMEGRRVAMSAVDALSLGSVAIQTEDMTVYADHLVVDGDVRTEGRSITIVCRKLVFNAGARIVSSGKPAEKSYVPDVRPQNSHTFGEDGLEGDSGTPGGDAGSVTIYADVIEGEAWIQAIGGGGGRGQDGGHGAGGAKGVNGLEVYITDRQQPAPAAIGGRGQTGGKPGKPGASGQGGKFGFISIYCAKSFAHKLEVAYGQPGAPSSAGSPGVGGPPGDGARVLNRVCSDDFRTAVVGPPGGWDRARFERAQEAFRVKWSSSEIEASPEYDGWLLTASRWNRGDAPRGHAHCRVDVWYRAGDLGVGDTPPQIPDAQPLPVLDPQPGEGVAVTTALGSDAFAAVLDDYYLELFVCSIENEFAETGTSATDVFAERIRFANKICSVEGGPSPVRKECAGRVLSMMQKVNLGLDYFGLSRSSVPLLGIDAYSSRVSDMLPLLGTIEKSFQDFWERSGDAGAMRESVTQSLNTAKSQLAGVKTETQRIVDATKPLVGQLHELDQQVAHCWEVLKRHESKLNEAIKRYNNGQGNCDALEAISCVAVIVSAVYTGGASIGAAVGAVGKLVSDFHDSEDLWDSRHVLGEDFTEIGDQYEKVETSILKLQAAWTKLKMRKPDVSFASPPQFRMNKAQLDQVCDKYAGLGLREADSYREAGYAYIRCVETRNDAIVDYNGLLLQLLTQYAKQKAAQRLIDELTTKLSTTFDPSDVRVKSMMSRLYLDSLNVVAQMVYAERKAINYHFARALDAPVSKFNFSSLAAAHIENLAMAKNAARAYESYQARRTVTELVLDVDKICDARAFEIFKSTGLLLFVIRRDGFYEPYLERYCGFRITGMEVRLPGVQLNPGYKSIPWAMTHSGTEFIYKRDGSEVKFTHRQISFEGDTSTSGEKPFLSSDFSADEMYAGVSPFAQWILQVSKNKKLGVELSGVHDMQLVLTGYMVEGL